LANKLNDAKIKFPIWGTCLGFESLLLALSEFTTPIENTLDDLNILLPAMIDFSKTSFLNDVYSREELEDLSTNNVFHYGHRWGFLMEKMNSDSYVQENINIVATTVTVHNQKVIAAFQHKTYPYFGIQFHPEFGQFTHEDGVAIDKTELGIALNRKFAAAVHALLKGTPTRMTYSDVLKYKKDIRLTLKMFNMNESYYHIPVGPTEVTKALAV
jgi:hypothetical protein